MLEADGSMTDSKLVGQVLIWQTTEACNMKTIPKIVVKLMYYQISCHNQRPMSYQSRMCVNEAAMKHQSFLCRQ